MDYCLKATDEQSLYAALLSVGAVKEIEVKNEEGTVLETRYVPEQGYSLDIVGTIMKPTGNVIQQTTEQGTIEVPELVALEGFHVNLRGPADLSEKIEYIQYVPTEEEALNPGFVMPEPTEVRTPSPLADLLVYPKTPSRVWF